ncbi:MAG: hypothetical protein R6T96_03140 [Longimicrobiales bacterium]
MKMKKRGPAGSPPGSCGKRLSTTVVLLLVLSACSSGTEPVATLWEGNLIPSTPGGLTGTVAAVSQFGRTLVSIQIRQAEAEETYGWRVESGSCQDPGQILGGEALYPPLVTDQAGSAIQDTSLATLFRSGSFFAAVVFRQGQGGTEEILACGDLQEQ